jgi:methionyl-tRNA synthetase
MSFFITTAIDYTNGAPHIGHAYEKVLADVLARYHRLKGEDVFYLTGVDQHGQKVQQSAEKVGIEPQEYVDGITKKFSALWEKLDVKYDAWAATTDPLHKECVRANLQKLWDDKDPATGQSRWIYKKSQRGFYSVRQEQFLTDKERGPDGQFGPEWGVVEERDEENFYFRLTQDPATGLPGWDPKQWLLDFIDKRSADGKPFVVPDFRVSELRNAVEKLEGDLCISRPASRLKWGIPFPESFGAGFVTFVWFDALVNYITFAPGHDPHYGERTAKAPGRQEEENAENLGALASWRFNDFWPPLHVIGKDILIPAHGIYWPIMLKALGFTDEEMPTLLVHGWWNIRGKGGESEKMSKSLGNVVDPDLLADKYGPEALRYYLMSDIATGRDADFSEERLIGAYNTDLANSLGNLLNRSLSMAAKYRESLLTKADDTESMLSLTDPVEDSSINLVQLCARQVTRFNETLEIHETDKAIKHAGLLGTYGNLLVEKAAPWKLIKDEKAGNQSAAKHLDAVLYHLAESLRIIAILISPVLPNAAHGIFDQLNWKLDEAGKDTRFRLADAVWGGLPDGHILGKPVPLFPRIEVAA